MKTVAIILLGGDSTRFNSDVPKQFYPVLGKPLIYYTIKSFETSPDIDSIVLVMNAKYQKELEEVLNTYKFSKILHIVEGGATRQESALVGLFSLRNILQREDYVLIHDGARPLVDHRIIKELKDALISHHGATAALPSTDTVTLVETNNLEIVGTLNRNEVYNIQTPQAFRFGSIFDAHLLYQGKNVSDDTQLLSGITPIKIVVGNKKLLKITTKEDILFLETYLKDENND